MPVLEGEGEEGLDGGEAGEGAGEGEASGEEGSGRTCHSSGDLAHSFSSEPTSGGGAGPE